MAEDAWQNNIHRYLVGETTKLDAPIPHPLFGCASSARNLIRRAWNEDPISNYGLMDIYGERNRNRHLQRELDFKKSSCRSPPRWIGVRNDWRALDLLRQSKCGPVCKRQVVKLQRKIKPKAAQ